MVRQAIKATLRVCAQIEPLRRWIADVLRQSRGYLVGAAAELAAIRIEDAVSVSGGSAAAVQRGPFAGLIVPVTDETSIRAVAPYLVGSYERELHGLIEELLVSPYEQVINVGAGWGYYCVGLARSCPRSEVYAFERDENRRAVCRRMAKLNGVWNRLSLRGACDAESLMKVTSEEKRGLLLVDCEGCERELLATDAVAQLRSWDVLVEVHDKASTGESTGQILCDRFRASHSIAFINLQHRRPENFSELAGVDELSATQLLDEGRVYSRGWLWFSAADNRD